MITPSFWLLAFSMFLFLSLALIKRYSEMQLFRLEDKRRLAGRGYTLDDAPVLLSLGSAAGYAAVLVLALYINSPDVEGLYPSRWALWMILPPFLYWTSRAWLKAHRGEIHEDPVIFAVTDKQS
jgi:4-hydroxybenzoate polyprenyltransferase